MNEQIKKSAADSFAANPEVNKLHVTSNGQCFTDEHTARQEGNKVGNTAEARTVTTVMRSEVETEIAEILAPKQEGNSHEEGKGLSKKNKTS